MNKKALLLNFQGLLLLAFCLVSILSARKMISQNWASSLFITMPLCAFAGSIYAVKKYSMKNPHGRSFFVLSLGMGLVFAAEAISFLEKSILHSKALVSCSGMIFLLSYLFLISGLILEMKIGSIKLSWKKISSLLPVIIFSLGIIFYLEILSHSFYGLMDLGLFFSGMLVMIIAFEYEKGRIFFAWLMLGIGCALMIVGDILFNAFAGAPPVKAVIDLFWFFAYSLFSLGLFSFGFMLDDEEALSLERIKIEETEGAV